MSRGDDEGVEIEVEIKRETAAAYLVEYDEDKEVWLPKSQILDGPEKIAGGLLHSMTVTTWIAEEKGLV